ncbi:MAG: hypothetical protein GY772_15220 [bacterium]|nr:hypothetical protein [bacterium]
MSFVTERTGPYELSSEPDLAELFRLAVRKLQLEMRTHTVGTVVSYNPATQTADVSVDILQVVRDNNKPPSRQDPAPSITQPPIILKGIPVHFQGTQTAYATQPIKTGDKGELHVNDRSIQKWLLSGTQDDPERMWTHALSESVFYPAPLPAPNKLPPTDLAAHVIEGPLVKLGYQAVLGNARFGDDVAPSADMIAWMNSVTTAVTQIAAILNAAAPGSVTPPTLPPTVKIGSISSASSKVLSE